MGIDMFVYMHGVWHIVNIQNVAAVVAMLSLNPHSHPRDEHSYYPISQMQTLQLRDVRSLPTGKGQSPALTPIGLQNPFA